MGILWESYGYPMGNPRNTSVNDRELAYKRHSPHCCELCVISLVSEGWGRLSLILQLHPVRCRIHRHV